MPDADETNATMAGFAVKGYWSNVPLTAEDRWWVYLLGHDEELYEPVYVGMARSLARRLREHGRYWVGRTRYALVISVHTEERARQLESVMIALTDPSGNVNRPTLSWVERQHFDALREGWENGGVSLCGGCQCLVRTTDQGEIPETEPDERCTEHYGPARRAMGEEVVYGLMSLVGWRKPPPPTLAILPAFFGSGSR